MKAWTSSGERVLIVRGNEDELREFRESVGTILLLGAQLGNGPCRWFWLRTSREGLDDGETVGDGHLTSRKIRFWRASFDRDDGG